VVDSRFHHISSDHVTHHLFSRIPHYHSSDASKVIVPLMGNHYHGRGTFCYDDLKLAFGTCQWVEEDHDKDIDFGLRREGQRSDEDRKSEALCYRSGRSPAPEYKMREDDDIRRKPPVVVI
jgi:bifunctional Delta-12/omega-3 fatty acid desaturase